MNFMLPKEMKPILHVYNEYSPLRNVMLGSAESYIPSNPINSVQAFYYSTEPPRLKKLALEQRNLVEVLKNNGVTVFWANRVSDCDQLNLRDIAAVIGNKLLVCNPKEPIRECEIGGLTDLFEILDPTQIVWGRESHGCIEGGDIVIDGSTVFVGISLRTDRAGYEFINKSFNSQFNILKIPLLEGVLHLDTVFNVISPELALIYPEAFNADILKILEQRYQLIAVNKAEQFQLATNVLSLTPQLLIADAVHNLRVAEEIRNNGIKIISVDFTETKKIGGSFRCGVFPLSRGDS